MTERERIYSLTRAHQQRTGVTSEQPFTWEEDDQQVQIFPDEAPTPTGRHLAQQFLERHIYRLVWNDENRADYARRHPEQPASLVHYSPEWIKQQYDYFARDTFTYDRDCNPHARDNDPLDPRFTLDNLAAAARRQALWAEYRKQFFNDAPLGRVGNVAALDRQARTYRTIEGLISQLISPIQAVGPSAHSQPGK